MIKKRGGEGNPCMMAFRQTCIMVFVLYSLFFTEEGVWSVWWLFAFTSQVQGGNRDSICKARLTYSTSRLDSDSQLLTWEVSAISTLLPRLWWCIKYCFMLSFLHITDVILYIISWCHFFTQLMSYQFMLSFLVSLISYLISLHGVTIYYLHNLIYSWYHNLLLLSFFLITFHATIT